MVKFTPSEFHPHGDYADELYYPPEIDEKSSGLAKNFHSSSSFSPLYQFPSLNEEILDDKIDPYKNERILKRSILEFMNDDDYYQSEINQNPSLYISPKQMHIPKNVIKRVYDQDIDDENLYPRKVDLEFLKNNIKEVFLILLILFKILIILIIAEIKL